MHQSGPFEASLQQAVFLGTNVPFPLLEKLWVFPPPISNWVTSPEEPPSALDSHLMALSRAHGSISRPYNQSFEDIPEGSCRVAEE